MAAGDLTFFDIPRKQICMLCKLIFKIFRLKASIQCGATCQYEKDILLLVKWLRL